MRVDASLECRRLRRCCTGAIVRHPGMANPTLVVLTDRNDLDDQLFDGVFAEAVSGTEEQTAERLKSRWARVEAVCWLRAADHSWPATPWSTGSSAGPILLARR